MGSIRILQDIGMSLLPDQTPLDKVTEHRPQQGCEVSQSDIQLSPQTMPFDMKSARAIGLRQFLKKEEHDQSEYKWSHVERDLLCEVCGKVFGGMYYLTRHKRVDHVVDQPKHKYALCGEPFAMMAELIARSRAHFTVGTLEPFKCDVCPRYFSSPLLVERHLYVHAAEQSFTCSKCDENFDCVDDFVRHKRCHF